MFSNNKLKSEYLICSTTSHAVITSNKIGVTSSSLKILKGFVISHVKRI